MIVSKRMIAVAAMLVVATGCGRFANEDKKEGPRRLVSVSKQYTEIMFALHADSELVAVDVSSTYPPEAKKLPTVGYHRALSLEGMLAAKPTLILTGGPSNMGPEHVVTQLEGLKIPMHDFTTKSTDIEGTKGLIREMGAYFHKEARADSLCATLDAEFAKAIEAAKAVADTPRVAIIHFGQAMNAYFTIRGGVAGQMVKWAGGRMALPDSGGMQRLTSPEIIAKSDPDVILLTDFGYDRLSGLKDILALPGVAGTRAARAGRIFRIEEHDIIYLGPRTGANVDLIRGLLHQAGTKA